MGGKQEWLAYGLPLDGEDAQMPRAGDRAARDVPTCSPSERVGAVRERVHAAGWDVCVVVNEQRETGARAALMSAALSRRQPTVAEARRQ